MARRSNRCKCFATAYGASSSESTVHCWCKRYNLRLSEDPYDFICERNYRMLRKVCNKIFKDFIQSKRHEKYTIFDGGKSINVRIHRSGLRDDKNGQGHKNGTQINRHNVRNKIDYMVENEKQNSGITAGKNHDYNNDNTKSNKRKKNKNGNENENENDNEAARLINRKEKQRLYQRDKWQEEGYDNKTDAKTRTISEKLTKRHINDSNKSNSSILSKRSRTKNAKRLTQSQLNLHVQDKKIQGRKSFQKYAKNFHDDLNEGKHIRKGVYSKGSLEKLNYKANKYVPENHIRNKKLPVINGLRNKVRNGEKIVFDRDLKNFKDIKSPNANIKPSRGDEVKSCDLLRAQMEQRDFCKLCYQLKSRSCSVYACCSKMCNPNFCPNLRKH